MVIVNEIIFALVLCLTWQHYRRTVTLEEDNNRIIVIILDVYTVELF